MANLDIISAFLVVFQLSFLPLGQLAQSLILVDGIGKGFSFKTCTNTGRNGPTQHQCDSTYKLTDVSVRVIEDGPMKGVQIWKVPETNTYSITALAASGGTGVLNSETLKGAYVNAKFNLTEGDEIYMLVGQKGESACSPTNQRNNRTARICKEGLSETDTREIYGGGGGGGATYVFKKDSAGNFVALAVAGGGGGMSFKVGSNAIKAKGGLIQGGSGLSAATPYDGPGGGGGWSSIEPVTGPGGLSLLEGGTGGRACTAAERTFNWELSGGFGGGGGGCRAGGGGGGYTGGNVSVTDNEEHNGQGGSSFISELGRDAHYEPGNNDKEGEVEIALVLPCDCEFMCIYSDYKNKQFKCYCPPNHVLAEDKLHCIGPDSHKEKMAALDPVAREEVLSLEALIGIVLAGILLVLIVAVAIAWIVQKRHKKRLKAVGLEMLSQADYQLDRLRSVVQGSSGVTEYNPNYDFGGPKCTLQDQREIPRDNLTLVRPLGQGAFGEVYQGYLSNVPREAGDLPVAVKTLPALCTDQAEMDFLMEALIMSKFHHRNIVRFLGVCFEKHPRFIVLELLEGGDLKTFLRESRPKPGQPTRLTMLDLVGLALNIANGCQYLEENHFIHRDIAARNCLLTTKGPNREAKIADFGMARDIYRADYYRKGGKAMLPVKWMPPEAFLDGIFTSKTDVWSFGILLWEVFSLGYMPYPGRGNQEVMQFVTTGGRLEPPQNCPQPVYHIMTLCWHGIPERRPVFATVISRLQRCLQDPEVLHSPLPVFHRPPSVEPERTVMRPRDPDRVVLTVEPPKKFLEPDSPSSVDHLIGPQSPDIEVASNRRPRVSDNTELLDRLLEEEPLATLEPSVPSRGGGSGSCGSRGQYKRVFDYDNAISEESGQHSPEAEGVSACSTALVHHHPPDPHRRSEKPDDDDDHLDAEEVTGDTIAQKTLDDDSGKSSMENVSSQADDVSRTSIVPSSSSPAGTRTNSHGNNIARCRPSPRHPVTEHSSPLLLTKSVPSLSSKNKQPVNMDTTNNKICSNSATRSSIPKSPLTPQAGNVNCQMDSEPFDPWEPRIKGPPGASYENVNLRSSTTKSNSSERVADDNDRYSLYDSSDRSKDSSSAGDSGVVVDLQGNSSLQNKRHGRNKSETILL